MHVCEYALRCWRLKLRSHLRSEFYDVHAGAFAAPRLCQVHVLGTNVRRYVGRRGGRAVVPTEAAPARLRPAWRHPRSRRRRPVRGVAFRKGVILWACKEAQDAQDEAVLDEWLSEALVKIKAVQFHCHLASREGGAGPRRCAWGHPQRMKLKVIAADCGPKVQRGLLWLGGDASVVCDL